MWNNCLFLVWLNFVHQWFTFRRTSILPTGLCLHAWSKNRFDRGTIQIGQCCQTKNYFNWFQFTCSYMNEGSCFFFTVHQIYKKVGLLFFLFFFNHELGNSPRSSLKFNWILISFGIKVRCTDDIYKFA